MKKLLSHIVLFALLVVSPVSFSTSSIPNFYINVTLDAPLLESKRSSITVAHRVTPPRQFIVAASTPDTVIISFPVLPAIDRYHDIEHGRAPPVSPSV